MNVVMSVISFLLFSAAILFPICQLLTKKLKAPDFLQNVIYFLMIGLFFANSGIADKPYHVIPFMTTKPALVETDSVRSIPDTLTNNMCMLLTLMAAMIILYTIIRLGFQLKVWVKGSYLDAITNYAAFFLYHLAILVVCLVTIPVFGYGQLFFFCNYTSGEIMMSVQELVSAFRNDGMSILCFSYQIYMTFFLAITAGVFIARRFQLGSKDE